MRERFWETVPLDAMSGEEWEALCDGCGRCCLLKLEDEDTGKVHYTRVACRLFDDSTCRCGNYPLRFQLVKACIRLTPANLDEHAAWLPQTCAYRRLHLGQDLPDWHPLLTGRADSVHAAGISMAHRTVPEYDVAEDEIEDHILDGFETGNTE